MDERPDYDKKIAELAGEIAALRTIVTSLVRELPERGMYHVSHGIREHLRELSETVRDTQNDSWREYEAAAHNLAAPIEDAINDMWIDELAEGHRIRTVQPYPINPRDQVDPERGF